MLRKQYDWDNMDAQRVHEYLQLEYMLLATQYQAPNAALLTLNKEHTGNTFSGSKFHCSEDNVYTMPVCLVADGEFDMSRYPWKEVCGAEFPFDILKMDIEAIPKGGFKST